MSEKQKIKFKFQCAYCNKEFKSLGWFIRHITVVSKDNADCILENSHSYYSLASIYLDDDSI